MGDFERMIPFERCITLTALLDTIYDVVIIKELKQ
jgi:hypothetical protein